MERWYGKIEIRATTEVTSGVHVAKILPVARCDKTRGVTRERKAACNRAITSIQRVQPGNYSATALLSSSKIPSSVSIRLETLFDRRLLSFSICSAINGRLNETKKKQLRGSRNGSIAGGKAMLLQNSGEKFEEESSTRARKMNKFRQKRN